jgi:prolyl oligopeptidase
MKKNAKMIVFCVVVGLFIFVSTRTQEPPSKYPVTKKVDQVDDYFGTKVEDPYRWLEEMNSPETRQWINAQVEVTEKYLSSIEFRPQLKARLTELCNFERYSDLSKEGEYYIFSKNDGLQEHDVVYMQKGSGGKPEMLLDPNTFSKDSSVSLTVMNFSKDHNYLGYGISRGGSDWTEYYVMEVQTRKKMADHIQWTKYGISWCKDGFFYSRYDEPRNSEKLKAKNEFMKVYYHKLGRKQSADQLIYQDTSNPRLRFSAQVTNDEKYLVISVSKGPVEHNLIYYKNLEKDSPITPVIDKFMGHFRVVEVMEDRFLVETDNEAPNYKLVLIDPQKPQKEHWQTIIPEAADKLDYVSYVGARLIASYLKDANTRVSVFDEKGKKLYDVQLPGIGTAMGFTGKKEDNEVFYTFTSFTTPPAIYRYNIKENRSELFHKSNVKFNPAAYETRQVFYESKDKTRVPLFIVHKKGLPLDGQNPTMLYGYGGFDISMQPYFDITIIPLLENGGVYAMACLRGGGEYGEEWHRAGKLEKKQNVFDDFIAAAEYLVHTGYTSPQKLAIMGASNGGTLVAAVMNQRPDLFKVAIADVGAMDMLRFHKFTIGWAWIGELGSSENPEQFKFLYKYSPLHNIKAGVEYPATLVNTADHDDRVFPAHSFKYIATLQEKYQGKNPVLLHFETQVGHGAGTAISKAIQLYTDIFAFMFYNMNIKPVF